MSFEIGEAKEQGSNKKVYFKIKQGTQTYRILPPMGALAKDGIWNKWYEIHYGYKNSEGRMLIFQSTQIKNRKTKMIEQEDPALERIQKLEASKKKLTDAMKEMDRDSSEFEAAEEQLGKVAKVLDRYNLDKGFYMNAIDLQGQIGLLKLKYREFNNLKALRDRLREEETIDPISASKGIYITFSKSGTGLDTVVSVAPFMESIKTSEGRNVKDYKFHAIDEKLVDRLSKEASDLGNLYKTLTVEQVKLMVDKGTGGVDAVWNSLGMNDRRSESSTGTKASSAETKVEAKTSAPAIKKSAPVLDADIAGLLSEESDVEMETEVEMKVAPKTAAKKTSQKTAPVVKDEMEDISDEDFLANLDLE